MIDVSTLISTRIFTFTSFHLIPPFPSGAGADSLPPLTALALQEGKKRLPPGHLQLPLSDPFREDIPRGYNPFACKNPFLEGGEKFSPKSLSFYSTAYNSTTMKTTAGSSAFFSQNPASHKFNSSNINMNASTAGTGFNNAGSMNANASTGAFSTSTGAFSAQRFLSVTATEKVSAVSRSKLELLAHFEDALARESGNALTQTPLHCVHTGGCRKLERRRVGQEWARSMRTRNAGGLNNGCSMFHSHSSSALGSALGGAGKSMMSATHGSAFGGPYGLLYGGPAGDSVEKEFLEDEGMSATNRSFRPGADDDFDEDYEEDFDDEDANATIGATSSSAAVINTVGASSSMSGAVASAEESRGTGLADRLRKMELEMEQSPSSGAAAAAAAATSKDRSEQSAAAVAGESTAARNKRQHPPSVFSDFMHDEELRLGKQVLRPGDEGRSPVAKKRAAAVKASSAPGGAAARKQRFNIEKRKHICNPVKEAEVYFGDDIKLSTQDALDLKRINGRIIKNLRKNGELITNSFRDGKVLYHIRRFNIDRFLVLRNETLGGACGGVSTVCGRY